MAFDSYQEYTIATSYLAPALGTPPKPPEDSGGFVFASSAYGVSIKSSLLM